MTSHDLIAVSTFLLVVYTLYLVRRVLSNQEPPMPPLDLAGLQTAATELTAQTTRVIPAIQTPTPDQQPALNTLSASVAADALRLKNAGDAASVPPAP